MTLKRPCRSDTCSNNPQENARHPDRRPLRRQDRQQSRKSPTQHSAGRHRRPPTRSNLRYSGAVGIARERFSLRNFNHTRIVSYGRNDLAAGAFKDRCLHILKEGPHFQIATINDAIEAHQLKLTFETVPESFGDAEGVVSQAPSQRSSRTLAGIRGRRSRLREPSKFTRRPRYSTTLSSGTWCTPAAQRS